MSKLFTTTFKVALAITASLLLSNIALTASATNGNNGTIKIHEQGTPSGTENNDPKVCVFNVEGFKLDANQTGYLKFDVQGGDKPTGTNAGPYNFGPTNANGFYASQYFNLKPGHYKATLYGKKLPNGTLSDVKAKSKVFKVTCDSPTPTNTTTNGRVLGSTTGQNNLPGVLPATGGNTVINTLLILVVATATYTIGYKLNQKKTNV
jgi:hypothetical protein